MIPFSIPEIIQGILSSIAAVFAVTWWIVLPLALSFIFWHFWLYYIYYNFVKSTKYVLLEIKVPALIEKTPKAMEQIFAAAYGIYSFGTTFRQKYIEGMLKEIHIAFEIIGFAGGVHFYVRVPEGFRNSIEAAIYSQYPDAEVHLSQDYLDLYPRTLPNKTYDIFGTDYHFVRANAYPIRTYEFFEATVDEHRLDPIAAITEAMSKLKNDEAIWIQIMVRPTGTEWKAEAEVIRDKIIGRKKAPPPPGFMNSVGEFAKNFALAPAKHPEWSGAPEKKDEKNLLMGLTAGEKDIVEAIEKKIGKLGFETNVRFVFVDRRDSFTRSHIAAVMSTFHQYSAPHLNSFRPNVDTLTVIRGNLKLNKTKRLWFKKRRLWESYYKMLWPRKTAILNTEELATLYHFPSVVVEAPLLRRLGAKKGEPPATLPFE